MITSKLNISTYNYFFYIIFIITLYGFEKLLHILIKKQLKTNIQNNKTRKQHPL